MADVEGKRSYPYLSTNVWAELRSRFQRSLPQKVTSSYLQNALGFSSEKAAKNLLPQLRALGLIDADGAPTDLAQRYRLDSDYEAACQEMLRAVYPDELRDLYPGPNDDVAAVGLWFMRATGGGQASATIQARFYMALTSGKLPTAERNARTATPPGTGSTPTPAARGNTKAVTPKPERESDTKAEGKGDQEFTPDGLPGLHLDVQIHLDASASVEQIDAVFASMAKHLYGRE
jgi:Family of unknown function (DUF5343)